MTSILLASLLGALPPPARNNAPSQQPSPQQSAPVQLTDEEILERIDTFLGTIDTRISPEQWRAETIEIQNGRNIPALGPYPSRGEYEHCFTLEGPRGEFVQLTPAVAREVARAIEASRSMPRAKRREALEDRTRREEREFDSYADGVLSLG